MQFQYHSAPSECNLAVGAKKEIRRIAAFVKAGLLAIVDDSSSKRNQIKHFLSLRNQKHVHQHLH